MPYIPMAVLQFEADPVPPVVGPYAWYDASNADYISADSGSVYFWADISGNDRHAVQGIKAQGPITGTRTINGLNGLDFQGAMFFGTAIPASDRTMTRFVVAVVDSLAAERTLLGGRGTSGGNQLRVDSTTGRLSTVKEGIALLATQSNANTTAGVAFLATQTLTDADITHELDGTSETDVEATTFTAGVTTRIGAKFDDAESFDGIIGEILIYDSTLSSGDRNTVESYLKAKWGTP